MNANDPQFWMMISSIITAICFIVMAIALIAVAITVKRVVATVQRVEERIEPLITKVDAIGKQGQEISVSFAEVSANLSTATKHLAESTELIKDEVAEPRVLVQGRWPQPGQRDPRALSGRARRGPADAGDAGRLAASVVGDTLGRRRQRDLRPALE